MDKQMTAREKAVLIERARNMVRSGGPHEWGYRDLADGTFIADPFPFQAAQVLAVMTPEPAQPAETPEARAIAFKVGDVATPLDPVTHFYKAGELVIVEGFNKAGGDRPDWIKMKGKPGHCSQSNFRHATSDEIAAAFAATTARPTERGAVPEGWALVPINLTAEMEKAGAKGRQNSAISSFRDGWKYALAAVPALPATDQAAEVEAAAERIIHALPEHADRDWQSDPIQETEREYARPIARAALATQPATGRTMGGEEGKAAGDDVVIGVVKEYDRAGVTGTDLCSVLEARGFDRRSAQRFIQRNLDRGTIVLGKSLRIFPAALQNGGE